MDKPLIRIAEVAAIMGISQTTLAAGLIQQLYPFGNATKGKRGSYRYIIIRSRFEKYMAGADMLEHANYSEEGKSNEADDETLMSVLKAAKIMGIVPTTLEGGLQQNLYPFGNATRTNVDDGKRHGSYWRYIVFKKRFEKFISAGDMKAHEEWEQIYHYAVFKSKTDKDAPPRIICQRDVTSSEFDRTYFIKQFNGIYDKAVAKALEESMKLSEIKRLRRFCESAKGLYYTTDDVAHILSAYDSTIAYFCKKGTLKAANPDGHRWFIEIEAFNKIDPEQLPEEYRNRFKRYLKKTSELKQK